VAMFPHERSLVKKLEGKPFVLIGINADGDDPKLKEKNEKQQITWRSFRNGRSDGPDITDEWNVSGFPSLFIIDHKGIIRNKWVGSPGDKAIDEAVEELVKKAETDTNK
jgi:hypothetical protein